MNVLNNSYHRFDYQCESPINCYSVSVILNPGKYNFTCHGASGASSYVKGGAGGFASGIITLVKRREFFIFVGSKGHSLIGNPSFNGGGRGSIGSSCGGVGGGGTDIRLINSSDFEGLRSRIIVAGGGGGAECWGYGAIGGAGGGLSGCNGKKSSSLTIMNISYGGTQTSGGMRGQISYGEHNYNGHNGSFGHGGNGPNHCYGGGGGGGYFGGGGGSVDNGVTGSGSGGSSYISGHPGCFSMSSNHTLTNSSRHYSGLVFSKTIILNGEQMSNYGNGFVEIIKIDSSSLFMKRNNKIIGIQLIFILSS